MMILSFLSDVACVMLGVHLYFRAKEAIDKRSQKRRWDSF